MYRGYIKSWRKVLTSPMFQSLNVVQRDVFWILLHLANHEEREWLWKGETLKCKQGQFVTSLASIKALCAKKTTTQNIRTALNRLKTWQFLTNESTKEGRLITIINWDTYQQPEKKLTKELTADQQRPNKDLTPNKNERMKKKRKQHAYSAEFEEVWKVYPNSDGKFKAFEEWSKANGGRPDNESLITAINSQIPKWALKDFKYVPFFSTWLHQRRWEDGGIRKNQPTMFERETFL
jgi:hypothetical protein